MQTAEDGANVIINSINLAKEDCWTFGGGPYTSYNRIRVTINNIRQESDTMIDWHSKCMQIPPAMHTSEKTKYVSYCVVCRSSSCKFKWAPFGLKPGLPVHKYFAKLRFYKVFI